MNARIKAAQLWIPALVLLTGCHTQRNYHHPSGPRYSGGGATVAQRWGSDTLHVVSFNIEFALHVERAIALLTSDSVLRVADVLLLQEMDEPGTRKVAQALGMQYVYYPATFHLKHKRDVGNAVLSRFPIIEDEKLILPHVARNGGMQRIATAATLRVGDTPVRVYSAHLGTIINVGPERRREQLRTILADARPYPRVILGGDLNDPGVARVAYDMGYAWPTKRGPKTTPIGRFDHVLFKGLLADSTAAGTVLDVQGASDHRPVWAIAVLP